MWTAKTEEEAKAADDALVNTYLRALRALAEKEDVKSVAFPAISTGVFGFPSERAAKLVEERVLPSPEAKRFAVYVVKFNKKVQLSFV